MARSLNPQLNLNKLGRARAPVPRQDYCPGRDFSCPSVFGGLIGRARERLGPGIEQRPDFGDTKVRR